ncbi:arsenate reductase family protein [Roseobacter sp.]|uniref:arsenate reductase family protein n=1 Tax=Roseobacter sp. TaxID=1907202 RepID=UPI00385E05B5
MRLYGLKTCDTCRKALKLLPQAEFLDVRTDGVSDNDLKAALVKFGSALMNTRSTTWRALDEKDRTLPPIDLLRAHPALMKRPLVVTDDKMYLGWTSEVQKELGVA